MKKVFVVTLLLLSFILTGCRFSDSDNNVSNPTSGTYQPYSIYLFDMQSNFDGKNIASNYQKIEMGQRLKEEGINDQSIDLISFKVDAKYSRSMSDVGLRAALSRYYVTEYGGIMLDPDTNKVVKVAFQVSEKIDTDKDAPKITQEESYDIALKYLKHFGFDPNLGIYKLEKQDLKTINEGTSYEHKVYTYRFVKYIDDIVTTDSCGISITEYGSLLYYRRGDEIDDSKIKEMSIDYARVESLANECAADICKNSNYNSPSYKLSTPQLLRLTDGTYAITYGITISFTMLDSRLSTGISIVIPVS